MVLHVQPKLRGDCALKVCQFSLRSRMQKKPWAMTCLVLP